jgi:hypothetical protein
MYESLAYAKRVFVNDVFEERLVSCSHKTRSKGALGAAVELLLVTN